MILEEAIRQAERIAEDSQAKADNLKKCEGYSNSKNNVVSEYELRANKYRRLAYWLEDYKNSLEKS